MDNVDEENIHKIDLLEVILLTKAAWEVVTAEMIRDAVTTFCAITEPREGWQILLNFAPGKVESMPQAESKLGELLGAGYKPAEWKGAFDTGFAAENDTPTTVATVEKLCDAALKQHELTSASSLDVPQLAAIEAELMEQVDKLWEQTWVRGTHPTLEDLLNLVAKNKVDNSAYWFPGGDKEIIVAAMRGESEDMIELSEDEEEEEEEEEETLPGARRSLLVMGWSCVPN